MPESSYSALADRLLTIAYDITATSGPAALSLREVQRRAGVSAATAYWHYKGRADLLLAVSRRATAKLADTLNDAITQPLPSRTSDLAAVCLAYMHFARDHEGLFQAIVMNSSTEELTHPAESARGKAGLAAFEVLQRAVADYTPEAGTGSPIGNAALHVWAACHGLAVLLIDSPMAGWPESDKEQLRLQHVQFVLNSLSRH
ncbi:TetR/AcrR family transcriptional regulator [Arthrobacter zhaoguopingii]|uniref:TetR/AcrR family transcriptional regulator n=1 Tax=Arthrobacter zhaoguopingii TaxID=2681491 RepID=UPI00135BF1B4|nr:TetR/AcrR family transcriptional regulator [Arthrobacter zhaoguopingii]